MKKHYAAGGVVIKKENDGLKVLLIKDSYGHWTWPKGHIEENESPLEAAMRESSEETGLKEVRILEKLGTQEYYYTLEGYRIFKTVHIFLFGAEGDEKPVAQDSEIQDVCWLAADEALERIEYEGSRGLLEKGIKKFSDKR